MRPVVRRRRARPCSGTTSRAGPSGEATSVSDADRRVDRRACQRRSCHGPEVVQGVRAPRAPPLGVLGGRRRRRRGRRAHRGRWAGTRRDRRARACARSRRSTVRCRARRAARRRRRRDRRRRRARARRRAARAASSTIVRPRLRGIGSVVGSRAASASGVGNTWVSGPPSIVSGAPAAATIRPATVRAPATEICWPTTARTAVSNGSTLPGTRSPGSGRTMGPSTSSPASASSTAAGSASRSSSRRIRRTAASRSRRRRGAAARGRLVAVGVITATPWPCGRSSARWNDAPSHASTPGTARAARKATRWSAANGWRTARSRSITRP